jgi:hypothetical protein
MTVDSQAVKNTCNASIESKGYCFYGVAELRYDKCDQGMFELPDLPRLRAIEIIGWIGNRNLPKLKIMNY